MVRKAKKERKGEGEGGKERERERQREGSGCVSQYIFRGGRREEKHRHTQRERVCV